MKKISDVSKRAGLVFIIFAVIISMFAVNVQAAEKVFPSGLKSDEIEKAVENAAKDKNCVSAAVAVFSGDDIYTKYYGNADAENDIVTDENTVYEWGSVSKTMVWVSAMQLYEQGKLDLNEDVRKYLPEGFLKKLKYDTPITMIDLMNHKGGWQETVYTIQVDDENESCKNKLKAIDIIIKRDKEMKQLEQDKANLNIEGSITFGYKGEE